MNELASDFIPSSSLKAIQKQKKQFQITQLNALGCALSLQVHKRRVYDQTGR